MTQEEYDNICKLRDKACRLTERIADLERLLKAINKGTPLYTIERSLLLTADIEFPQGMLIPFIKEQAQVKLAELKKQFAEL